MSGILDRVDISTHITIPRRSIDFVTLNAEASYEANHMNKRTEDHSSEHKKNSARWLCIDLVTRLLKQRNNLKAETYLKRKQSGVTPMVSG